MNGIVTIYSVRGFSPINIRANSDVIVTPTIALNSGRCRVLHDTSLSVVARLKVRNNYGYRFTLGPRDFRCDMVRIGPHISHSSTLTSGTANCPVTGIAAGVTLNCALSRVQGSIANGAYTYFRPALSCIIIGIPG